MAWNFLNSETGRKAFAYRENCQWDDNGVPPWILGEHVVWFRKALIILVHLCETCGSDIRGTPLHSPEKKKKKIKIESLGPILRLWSLKFFQQMRFYRIHYLALNLVHLWLGPWAANNLRDVEVNASTAWAEMIWSLGFGILSDV